MQENLELKTNQKGLQNNDEHLFWTQLLDKAVKWEIKALDDARSREPKTVIADDMDFSKIPEVEKEIKMLSFYENQTKEERLGITRSFTDTSKRLMTSEKLYKEYQERLYNKLLPIKMKKKSIDDEKLKRAQEIVDFKIKWQLFFNNEFANANKYIQDTISKMYSDCLESVEPEDVSEVIEAYENTVDDFNFQLNEFEPIKDLELQAIRTAILVDWSPESFVKSFRAQLHATFSNFKEAKKDKAKAEEDRKAVQLAAEDEIINKNIIENMFTSSLKVRVDEVIEIKTKKLIKYFILDRSTPIYNILKEFVPRMNECLHLYKGRDRFDVVLKIVELLESLQETSPIEGLNFEEKYR